MLADSQWSFVQKLMAKLDAPVRTVLTLRLCFFLAPAINYVLALSSVSFRNFFIGTAAGLAGPLTVAVFFIDRLIEYMGWSKAQNAEIGHALHELGDEFEFGSAIWLGRHGRGCFFEDVKCIKNRDSHALRFSASRVPQRRRACAASLRRFARMSHGSGSLAVPLPERETIGRGAVAPLAIQSPAPRRRSATPASECCSSTTGRPLERRANPRGRLVRGHARGVRGGSRSSSRSTGGTRRRAVRQAPGDRGGRTEPLRGAPPRRAFSSASLLPTRLWKSKSRRPRTARPAHPRRPTRLRVAMSAPAQTRPPPPRRWTSPPLSRTKRRRVGPGHAARRGAADGPPRTRTARRQSRVRLSPGPYAAAARKHSGGSDGFDGKDEDDDEVEDDDENEVEVDDEAEGLPLSLSDEASALRGADRRRRRRRSEHVLSLASSATVSRRRDDV